MTENLKVRLEVDTRQFQENMKKAREDLDKANDKVEEAKTEWASIGDALGDISPLFKKISDSWKNAQAKMDGGSKKASKGFKAMKAAGVLAVAAIAVEVASTLIDAFKQVWQVADDTARMFDTVAYSKAAGALQKSTRTLKTTIGSFTAPVVNALKTGMAKILDGFNWLLTKIRVAFSYIAGVFQSVISPIVSAIRSAIDYLKNGINAIAMFLGADAIFKEASKNTEDAADSMEELVEATSAGLASFDKLSTLNFGEMGDAEQSDKLKENMEDARDAGKDLGERIKEFFGGLWTDITDSLGNIWEWVTTELSELWSDIKDTADRIWIKITETVGNIWEWLTQTLSELWDDVKRIAGEIWTKIKEAVGNMWKLITTPGSDLLSEVGKWASKIWDTVKSKVGNIYDVMLGKDTSDSPGIDTPKPVTGLAGLKNNLEAEKNNPSGNSFWKNLGIGDGKGWFANGGVFEPNNPMLIGIGDNRVETEIVSPLSTMKTAFKEALMESGGMASGGGSTSDITLVIDGKKLVRMTFDDIISEAQRRGMKVIG